MDSEEGVKLPARQTNGSAGYDFYMPYDVDLKPGEWTIIDTGVRFDGEEIVECATQISNCTRGNLLHQWFMMVVPRSGLGTKFGFRMRNTLGIIDSDYRDTIKACVTVDKPLHLKEGERFMQGIIMPFGVFIGEEVPVKAREGGHGSTGQ